MAQYNEGPVFLLLNPFIDHSRKDLPVDVYETGAHHLQQTSTAPASLDVHVMWGCPPVGMPFGMGRGRESACLVASCCALCVAQYDPPAACAVLQATLLS